MAETHVVLGSGQIGSALARALSAKGHDVLAVRRSAPKGDGGAEPGVRVRSGDVSDPAFAADVARGASVLYQVMSPAYHRWGLELPPLTEGVLHAARTSGARLVVLDNLYMFGRRGGAPMKEDDPQEPCSKKGVLRKAMAERYLAASARGEIRLAIGRASDFVGPGIVQAHLGERFFTRTFAGQAGECFGPPSMEHAFTYGPDIVEGLVTLGADDRALGRAWHLPTLPARPVEAWVRALSKELGRDLRIREVPGWVASMLGVFSPMVRELAEMRYQWQEPYRLDDTRYRETFGAAPTPFEEQVRATAAWAAATYGPINARSPHP